MNPGEIVQLKSGGEAMTVEFVGEPARERFALAALQLYDAAKDATRGVFVPDRPPPTSLPGLPGNRSVR